MVEGSRPEGEARSRPENGASKPARQTGARAQTAEAGSRVLSIQKAMEEALQLYKDRQYGPAAHLCAHIIAARPRMAPAHNLMGVILNAEGKKKEAVKSVQRAVNLQPRNGQFLANLGEIERQRGKLQEALAALACAISVSPKLPQAHNNMGIVRFERKEYELALESFRRALSSRKRYAEAHNNMGNALRALGRQDEALEAYRTALEIRDDYAEAYSNMAAILRQKNQNAEAEQCYRKAISTRPDYLPSYIKLAEPADQERSRPRRAERSRQRLAHRCKACADAPPGCKIAGEPRPFCRGGASLSGGIEADAGQRRGVCGARPCDAQDRSLRECGQMLRKGDRNRSRPSPRAAEATPHGAEVGQSDQSGSSEHF